MYDLQNVPQNNVLDTGSVNQNNDWGPKNMTENVEESTTIPK